MLLSFPDYNHSSTMYVLEQCRFRVLLGNEQNIKRGGCQKGETGSNIKRKIRPLFLLWKASENQLEQYHYRIYKS